MVCNFSLKLYLCMDIIILKPNIMQKLLADIKEQIDQFEENAALQVEKSNKAAGGRARKASLELEKLLKAFRKASLDASK